MAKRARKGTIGRTGLILVALSMAGSLLAQTTSAHQTASVPPQAAPAKPAAPVLTPDQRRLADLLADADHLVELAQQLKGEVDKTNEYTLSLKAIKRAEEIQSSAKALSQRLGQK
jgi:glucose/arabinose dehydrogenase